MDTSPRIRAEIEIAEEQARFKEQARANQAALAVQAVKNEATARLEAQVKAVPSDLFADDPEIKALRADFELKQRQRPVVANADPERVHRALTALKERINTGMLDAMIAAVEDVMTGDPALRRAMVFQRQVDEDGRKVELLTKTLERLCRAGFSQTAKEREQLAGLALEAALLIRKRQHVRKEPEPPAQVLEAAPTAAPVAQFAPPDDDDNDSPFPTYAMPVTLRQAAQPPARPSAEVAPAANDVIEV